MANELLRYCELLEDFAELEGGKYGDMLQFMVDLWYRRDAGMPDKLQEALKTAIIEEAKKIGREYETKSYVVERAETIRYLSKIAN